MINITNRKTKRLFAYSAFILSSTNLVYSASNQGLGIENMTRLNGTGREQVNDYWLRLQVTGDSKVYDNPLHYDVDGRWFFENQSYAYSVPELHYSLENGPHKFTIGRKILEWESFQKFWMLSNINGQKNFDLISTEQEGLVGGFYTYNRSQFFIDGYGSLTYVPSMNPGLKVKDGELSSNIDWVKMPPKALTVYDRKIPIKYKIDYPDVNKVVLNGSIGARSGYRWNGGGLSFYTLFKPENNLRINASAILIQDDPTNPYAQVTAHPIVNYELITGGEVKHKIDHLEMFAGFETVDPNADFRAKFMDQKLIQMKNSDKSFSTDNFKISPSYDRYNYLYTGIGYQKYLYGLSFNYINLFSKTQISGDDFYSDAPKWTNAFGVESYYRLSSDFKVGASWRYDISRLDNILKLELNYHFFKTTQLKAGVELLDAPSKTSYWASYRTNDSVYTHVQTTF